MTISLRNCWPRRPRSTRALKNKDHAALAELLAQQKLAVIPDLGRLPLSEVLKLRTTMKSYSISDAKAIPLDQDNAILSYKYTWSGTRDGDKEVKNHTSFATSIWSKFDGKWRPVFYQATPE